MQSQESSSMLSDEKMQSWKDDMQTAVNDLSLMALQGIDNPAVLDQAERCLYYALAELYRKHKVGEMSTDECKRLKQEAVRQYEKDRSDIAWYLKLIQTHAKMWNRIEHAGAVYAQSENRTPEADAFFEAVYGCRPKERGEQHDRTETE